MGLGTASEGWGKKASAAEQFTELFRACFKESDITNLRATCPGVSAIGRLRLRNAASSARWRKTSAWTRGMEQA